MGRMGELPTRQEVAESVEEHETDMSEKLEELDIISTDTEAVRETLAGLDLRGTADGADATESAFKDAEDVTVEIFDREDSSLEGIQTESEQHESELQDRSDTSQSDLGKISEASGRIETQETVSGLVEAKTAVLEDIDFLKDEIEQEKRGREQTEQQRRHHQSRVRGGGR